MAAPETGHDETEWRMRYHPSLDGLRAAAIVLVLLFHYPWTDRYLDRDPVHGGFLGVDVFFVLSGFLITALLLQEQRDRGGVSMRAFYARRALRLLPAFAVLFGAAVIARYALVDTLAQPTGAGLLGMAFYCANWVQIWFHDPLPPMFAHTWSLAIEEQFYLLFPLAVVGLARVGVRRGRLVAALVAGALASALWRAVLARPRPTASNLLDFYAMVTGRSLPATDPFRQWNRWYFGTDAHLDGLLFGCAAAAGLVVWGPLLVRRLEHSAALRRALGVATWCALFGVAVVVRFATILDHWVAAWGLLLLEVCVVVAVVAIVLTPSGPAARFFSAAPLVWLGRRSYAVYLFHQLVFYELAGGRVNLPQPWLFVVMMVAVLLAAEVSWRVIEQPFLRRKARFQRTVEVVS
jgi:peptidoglycan/LPS O-acetylase OafA/YrhL